MLTPESCGYMPPRQPNTAGRIGYWRGSHTLAGISPQGPVPAESQYPKLFVLIDSPLYEQASLASTQLGTVQSGDVYAIRAHSYGYANPPNPPHVGSMDYSWWLVADQSGKLIGWICGTALLREKEPTKPLTDAPTAEDGVVFAAYALPVSDKEASDLIANDKQVNDYIASTTAAEAKITSMALPSSEDPLPRIVQSKHTKDDSKNDKDGSGGKDKKKASSTPWLLVAGVAAAALFLSKRGAK